MVNFPDSALFEVTHFKPKTTQTSSTTVVSPSFADTSSSTCFDPNASLGLSRNLDAARARGRLGLIGGIANEPIREVEPGIFQIDLHNYCKLVYLP